MTMESEGRHGMQVAELVERCQSGDELAWEVLVRTYQSRIYGIAYAYVGNADEARDLAQDAFIRVYQRLHTCREPERFLPWLVRLARNVCLDHLRRQKARPALTESPVEEMDTLHTSDPSPEEDLTAQRRRDLIYQGLQRLGSLSRDVLVLKEMQELKITEIAEMLRVPQGTIKSRLNRARLELAQAITTLMQASGDEVSP